MAHNKTTEPLIANVVILFMQVFFFKKRFSIYILNEKKTKNKKNLSPPYNRYTPLPVYRKKY